VNTLRFAGVLTFGFGCALGLAAGVLYLLELRERRLGGDPAVRGVREQVVRHRDIRVVLGPLEDVERPPGVTRAELGIFVVGVQA